MQAGSGSKTAIWGFWALGVVLGCGKVTDVSDVAPGGAAGMGGGVASGDAGMAGGGGAIRPPLEPSTCGVLRTLQLPRDVPNADDALVARQAGGFSFGPWHADGPEVLQGLLIDETWQGLRPFHARGGSNDNHWPLFLAASELAVQVFLGPLDASSGDDAWSTRVWSDGDDSATKRGALLHAWWRGTDAVSVQPALDGQRAVLAVWPIAISEPRAALMGPDARLVGGSHSLSPTSHLYSTCESILPTAHGGIVSFIDSETRALRLVELGADGALALDVTWPLPADIADGACPILALDGTRLAFLLRTAEPTSFLLGRVNGTGEVDTSEIDLEQTPTGFAALGDQLLVLRSDSTLKLEGANGSPAFPTALEPGSWRVVPSEAGTIYLDVSASSGSRQLVELGCAPPR